MTEVFSTVEKAARGDRRRIEELLARAEAAVRRAFRRFLDDVRSPAVTRRIRLALETGGVEAALEIVDAYSVRLGSILPGIFAAAAETETGDIARKIDRTGRARIAISFDPTHPRAAEIMRRRRLRFIREFSGAQRQATRAALTEALQSGAGPIQAARALRASIGLTEMQRRTVANYRRLLETQDAAALTRDLRDRRFDRTVRRAVTEKEPLGAASIDRMVERYRSIYLQYRSETIARTESLAVISEAREEALRQVVEDVGLPQATVRRTWMATLDARVRDTHAGMDEQVRGMEEPFVSPSGALLMMPGDASLGAPAGEIINCRCVVRFEITPPDEVS